MIAVMVLMFYLI